MGRFYESRKRARRIASIATDRRLRPLTYVDIEPPLHAALAAYVSAWEAYVESVILEFLDVLISTSNPTASAFAKTLRDEAERAIQRFNTPNFDESRNLIYRFTGFDPYSEMNSARLGLNSNQAQARLNEVLRVRHAFAHGKPVPNLAWLTRYSQQSRLSKKAIKDVEFLISDIAESIDAALRVYARSTFSSASVWP